MYSIIKEDLNKFKIIKQSTTEKYSVVYEGNKLFIRNKAQLLGLQNTELAFEQLEYHNDNIADFGFNNSFIITRKIN